MDQLTEAVRAGIERSPHPERIRQLLAGDVYEMRDAEEHVTLCAECTAWLEGRGITSRIEEIRELLAPEPEVTPMPPDGPCCRDWPHLYD